MRKNKFLFIIVLGMQQCSGAEENFIYARNLNNQRRANVFISEAQAVREAKENMAQLAESEKKAKRIKKVSKS